VAGIIPGVIERIESSDAFHNVDVPIHHNEHIAAAASRADRKRVRQAGRWLARHCTALIDARPPSGLRCSPAWTGEDILLIPTIGLLSERFGPLAADAVVARRWLRAITDATGDRK
jgi:hypothetical protein